MAGERTFTEGEAYALVEDGVKRETAALTETVGKLEAQVVTLGNEKDALELRATAAEEKAANAEKALDDYKAEVEAQKAAEAKRTERLEKVAEVAPSLVTDDDKGQERADRIVAMADDAFDEYVDGLRQIAAAAGDKTDDDKGKGKGADGALPRESAAFKGGKTGEKPNGSESTASVKGLFGARRALSTTAKSA